MLRPRNSSRLVDEHLDREHALARLGEVDAQLRRARCGLPGNVFQVEALEARRARLRALVACSSRLGYLTRRR
ncbi:hypothetical protein [Variovorax sp. Sphag1AA]|uniref:hypothetical protein n=1 Tax=Variovorax sp. Sphag1AA TaxID=2587027 RepID=UPI00161BB108|nr:hypothetical protein [Variovorax sp. Sphag1AA]MBB3180085.1 hypothetical protein [Variovorax sp. Sphag1AA]